MSDTKSKDNRSRLWATIVYPESAPANWLELLSEKMVPCFVSPLHDKDLNANGEPKKPHYHVMFVFEGKKSQEQIKTLCAAFSGVGQERIASKRAYARYLCHLDNPEKAQYNVRDVKSFCGLDYELEVGAVINKYTEIGEMIRFIETNDIRVYAHLLRWCSVNEPKWFRVLCDNGSYPIIEYIKSRTYAIEHGYEDEDEEL